MFIYKVLVHAARAGCKRSHAVPLRCDPGETVWANRFDHGQVAGGGAQLKRHWAPSVTRSAWCECCEGSNSYAPVRSLLVVSHARATLRLDSISLHEQQCYQRPASSVGSGD
jgi:hypothetical protein